MNKINQITSKTSPPKEKTWTIQLLLENPKSKIFPSHDLEKVFLNDPGAESNIIKIPTWVEIHSLHPKLSPSKTSIKLATAQGTSHTNYGKI